MAFRAAPSTFHALRSTKLQFDTNRRNVTGNAMLMLKLNDNQAHSKQTLVEYTRTRRSVEAKG